MRSNSKPARITVLLSAAAGLLFSFQNCSGGFKDALDLTGQSTFSSSSAPDGIALYTTNCSQCHGDISVSIKQGRSASQISSAMINIGQMNFLKLSASEIDAISAALNNAISVTPIQIPTLPIGQVRVALNSNELNAPQAFRGVMMRRLTRQEISNVLMDVLNVDPVSLLGRLPTDIVDEALNPFDNDASTQSISSSVIESYESFAESYANLFLSSSAKINLLAGCTPSSASDLNCFNQFATRVGRLLLRREITAGDLLRYKALSDIAVAENNFYSGPRLLIQMFLQNPEFLYRIESGQAISGSLLRSLTDYEIANRMSFLIWGSAPDSALLDAAAAGQLKVELSRQAQAERLWASS